MITSEKTSIRTANQHLSNQAVVKINETGCVFHCTQCKMVKSVQQEEMLEFEKG